MTHTKNKKLTRKNAVDEIKLLHQEGNIQQDMSLLGIERAACFM